MRSCTACTIPFPVITPEDLPIVLPAALTPALRQSHPGQLNDQPWASTSAHNVVQMRSNMMRKTFFMRFNFLYRIRLFHGIQRSGTLFTGERLLTNMIISYYHRPLAPPPPNHPHPNPPQPPPELPPPNHPPLHQRLFPIARKKGILP